MDPEASSSAAAQFKYPPLPNPKHGEYIRLVALEPPPPTGERQLILSILPCVDLSDAPPYEALSYTWIDKVHHPNKVQTQSGLPVLTPNLVSALLHLQLPDKRRLLWVDAICIDQKNVPERNWQVTLMRRIYANATKVVVWVGDEDETTALAFDTIARCAIAMGQVIGPMRDVFEGHEQKLEAIKTFLRRRYFTRLWIIQEIVAAEVVEVHCGPYVMPWGTLHDAVLWLHVCGLRHYIDAEGLIIMDVSKWRSEHHRNDNDTAENASSQGGPTLYELLAECRFNQSSDDRDRIFSLIGISREANDQDFAVDYSMTPENTYIKFTRLLIAKSQTLDVLSLMHNRDKPSQLNLPSWVPNFGIEYGSDPLSHRNIDGVRRYTASYDSIPVVRPTANEGTLGIQGIRFDTVSRHYAPLDGFVDTESNKFLFLPGILRTMVENSLHCNYDDIYPHTDETYLSVYNAVLSAHLDYFSPRIDEWYIRRFFPSCMEYHNSQDEDKELTGEILAEFGNHIAITTVGRHVVVTKEGWIGLAPKETENGDVICVLSGGNTPFVLRPLERGQWEFIGDCYIHGIMDGEAFQAAAENNNFEIFEIV